MSRQERYRARVEISMLFRAANQFEDRQSEEGRTRAAELRKQANEMSEDLRRTK